jgi:hypothetical protein
VAPYTPQVFLYAQNMWALLALLALGCPSDPSEAGCSRPPLIQAMLEETAAVLDTLAAHLTALGSRAAGRPALLSSRPRATAAAAAAAASGGSRAAKKAEKKAAKKEAKKQGHR